MTAYQKPVSTHICCTSLQPSTVVSDLLELMSAAFKLLAAATSSINCHVQYADVLRCKGLLLTVFFALLGT
jgi:hypothetical protein